MAKVDVIGIGQIVVTLAFLGILFAAWLFVKVNKTGLRTRLSGDRRMDVREIRPLSATTQAVLLTVDNRELVIVTAKGAQPVIHDLGTRATNPVDASTKTTEVAA